MKNPVFQNPLEILKALKDKRLRFCDRKEAEFLFWILMANPHDIYAEDWMMKLFEEQLFDSVITEDPFYSNYPPIDYLSKSSVNIPLLFIPRGDSLSLESSNILLNFCVIGPPGCGKTTYTRWFSKNGSKLGITFIILDRKGDFIDEIFKDVQLLSLKASELKIDFLGLIKGMELNSFINTFVNTFFHEGFGLEFTTRIISKALEKAYSKDGIPTLKEIISILWQEKPSTSWGMQRKEIALTIIEGLDRSLGHIFNHTSSKAREYILNFPGIVVIDSSDESDEDSSMIFYSLFFWAYHSRRLDESLRKRIICFISDDALKVVQTKKDETGPPSEDWFRLGRGLGIASGIASQFYPGISPVIRSCIDTVVVCRASGADAELLKRDLCLDDEQTKFIQILGKGQCVVLSKSVWPYPVFGYFPKS